MSGRFRRCRAGAVLLVAWLAMPGGVQAQSTPPAPKPAPEAESPFAAIRALIDDGNVAAALERLATLDQSDPQVRLLKGVAFFHADRPGDAAMVLEPLREQLPAGSPARHEADQVLGLCLFLLNRYGEAIPLLERTRELMPDDTELLFTLGQAYIHTRDAARARSALAGAFGLPADSAAAHVAAAQLMIRLQIEDLAETELKAALEKAADTPRANYLLGQLALFRGRLDEAVARTRRELEINPTDAMSLAQLGDAFVRQGRWDEAIAALQRSIWLNPFYSGPYILLGQAYLAQGQPATAEGLARKAIAYDPNNRTAHYLLGQALQRLGRMAEAREAFAAAERLQNAR
ncbi:MAG TPA: tetratricopeptide repeat protein [Vicinamibacterales bacterium]